MGMYSNCVEFYVSKKLSLLCLSCFGLVLLSFGFWMVITSFFPRNFFSVNKRIKFERNNVFLLECSNLPGINRFGCAFNEKWGHLLDTWLRSIVNSFFSIQHKSAAVNGNEMFSINFLPAIPFGECQSLLISLSSLPSFMFGILIAIYKCSHHLASFWGVRLRSC